jgi:ribosome maturation factor RimP
VTLADGSQLTGRVGASDESGVSLDVSGAEQRLAYDDISKALVQVEFNRKTKES